MLTFLAVAIPSAAIILAALFWPHHRSYRDDRNGSWIAEDRPWLNGILTTWREVTPGTVAGHEEE